MTSDERDRQDFRIDHELAEQRTTFTEIDARYTSEISRRDSPCLRVSVARAHFTAMANSWLRLFRNSVPFAGTTVP